MNVRRVLIRAGLSALTRTRADRRLARRARGLGAILMLHHVRPYTPHGFAPNRLLEITPEFLGHVLRLVREEGFEPIGLDQVAGRLAPGAPEKPFVVFTFDDGYRDNVEHALPLMQADGVPWTLFVTTGFADRSASLWWLELEAAVAALPRIVVEIGGRSVALRTATDVEKARAFELIYWRLRAGPEPALRAVVAELAMQAGIDGRAIVEANCLDWDDIRELSSQPGVDIGAHTLTHPTLAKQDEVFARQEIVTSRAVIERHIGRTVRHFAYPMGDAGSAGPREFALAETAGYKAAVTARPGHVFPGHAEHLLALPRISLNGLYQTEKSLRALLSGVPLLMWNRGRKINVG